MARRKRIGLIYRYDENWIGGTYYIENIIYSLNTLTDPEKPLLYIYAKNVEIFKKLQNATNYPYFKYISTSIKYNIIERILNKISRLVFKRNLIDKRPGFSGFNNDFIFPNPDWTFFKNIDANKKVFWIPDFQEEYLPDFFSNDEIADRKEWQSKLAREARTIVMSSKDSYTDFERLYPASNAKKIILPFAVRKYLANTDRVLIRTILEKYNIANSFFLIPNQLWIHKNHKTVIYAIKELVNIYPSIQYIFTGKEHDYRFPDYPVELKQLTEELNIQSHAKFIGFIPKEDLENLINASIAIIQPSLFEGWSTVIEESKQHNKFIIASDISIHYEQLENYPNKIFFSRNNPLDLADSIRHVLSSEIFIEDYLYEKDVQVFAKGFLNILDA